MLYCVLGDSVELLAAELDQLGLVLNQRGDRGCNLGRRDENGVVNVAEVHYSEPLAHVPHPYYIHF